MAVTIYDIAAQAGVSHTAVSAVVNGRVHQARIGAATAARIRAVAQRLGYQRNALAHAVVSGRTRIIAIITSEPEKEFIGRFLHGALAVASDRGYLLHLQSVSAATNLTLATALDRAAAYRPVGLYLCALDDAACDRMVAARLARLVGEHLPVVHTHCRSGLPGAAVDSDDEQGAAQAVRHLAGLGHRRIAYLGGVKGQRSSEERLAGFRRALADIPLTACGIACTDWRWDTSLAAARRLLKRPRRPTAILCASDSIAAAALHAARDLGLAVPGDLSLVGFTDQEVGQFVAPHLTTVDQPHHEIGRQAVTAILDVAEREGMAPAIATRRLATHLLIRASTAPPPSETR